MYNAIMLQFLPGRSYLYSAEITPNELPDIKVDQIDLISVDLGEMAVKDLRTLISTAQEKPFGENRLLWLRNAVDLSDVVQNTLLKIIEEPPAQLIIVVQASSADDLLPTLRSRLHFVNSATDETVFEEVFPASVSELDKTLRGIKERAELVKLISMELSYLKKKMLEQPSKEVSSKISLLLKTITRLKQNCNQKLAIDSLLLHWFEDSGKA